LQLGVGWLTFFIMNLNYIIFYGAQWEEYHTGVMELGYLNVTEAQLLVMLVHVLTAFWGSSFWLSSFCVAGFCIQYNHLFVLLQAIGAFATLFGNFVSLFKFIRSNNNGQGGVSSIGIMASHLIPVVVGCLGVTAWAKFSPHDIVHTHPHLLLVGQGFFFANLVGRIVLNRVCKENFVWHQPLLVLTVFPFLNVFFFNQVIPELLVLRIFCAVNIIAYLYFAISVIKLITNHLNIYCLKINPPKKQTQVQQQTGGDKKHQ